MTREIEDIPYSDYARSSMFYYGANPTPTDSYEYEPSRSGGLTVIGTAVLILLSEAFGLGVGYLVWGW